MIDRNVEANKLLGANLKRLRMAKNLSQHQLYLLSGIALSQIGKIEAGVGNPTISTALELVIALEVTLDALLPPAEYHRFVKTGLGIR
jgi:transcriptional regulator with XRE-family HTH domain